MSDSPQTVLITGAAQGIGHATACHFAAKGWRVIATVRTLPRKPRFLFPEYPDVIIKPLDVTKAADIKRVFGWLQRQAYDLDVLVNNAGLGLYGPFEGAAPADIAQVYRVNVLGLMEVTRAAIPLMRTQGKGTIVNISSIGGKANIPYYATYGATKAAVESFTEGLQREVEPFGIRLKLVEPGGVRSEFFPRAVAKVEFPRVYGRRAIRSRRLVSIFQRMQSPERIARVIYRAGTSPTKKLRYAGAASVGLFLFARRFMPDRLYARLLRLAFG